MAELIGEKGNVIVIEGIPGYSASDQQNKSRANTCENGQLNGRSVFIRYQPIASGHCGES
jgi:hypothetical protein